MMRREVRAGRIPPGGQTVMWGGSGIKPARAVDPTDERQMWPWRQRAYVIVLSAEEFATAPAAALAENPRRHYVSSRS